MGVYEDRHVTLLHGPGGLLQDQMEFSAGTVLAVAIFELSELLLCRGRVLSQVWLHQLTILALKDAWFG